MFKIKGKETVVLSKEQLIQSLIEKIAKTEKKDHEILAKTIAESLEVNGIMKSSSILQIIVMSFSLGYFYKVFLSKNNVEIEISDTEHSNQSND